MLTKILFFIIFAIIIYDVYLTFNIKNAIVTNNIIPKNFVLNNNVIKDKILNDKVINDNVINNKVINDNIINDYTSDSYNKIINKNIISSSESNINTPLYKKKNNKKINMESYNIDYNMYGTPTSIKENEYIIWSFYEPNPWTKIIYKYHEEYPFYFFIKIKIPSLNDYENWKNIITNLEFNPSSGEIIIPSKDEETALAIANLIISNFNNSISLSDIINKDLIGISILKIKKYENIKNKIKEQIMNSYKSKSIINNNIEFQADLALNNMNYSSINNSSINNSSDNNLSHNDTLLMDNKSNKIIKLEQNEDFTPWEGSEFSFI